MTPTDVVTFMLDGGLNMGLARDIQDAFVFLSMMDMLMFLIGLPAYSKAISKIVIWA